MAPAARTGEVAGVRSGRRWPGDLVLDTGQLKITAGVGLCLALVHPLLPDGAGITCPLRAVTGIPCPLCGMTTSVVAATHGDIAAALAANPGGVVIVALALFVLASRPRAIDIPALPALLVLGAMWIFELFRFSVLAV